MPLISSETPALTVALFGILPKRRGTFGTSKANFYLLNEERYLNTILTVCRLIYCFQQPF